jgi:hypothetical protein
MDAKTKMDVDALMTRAKGELHAPVVIVLQMEYFQNRQYLN